MTAETGENGGYAPSLFDRVDTLGHGTPQACPHCGEYIAHPDDMKVNDDLVRKVGGSEAYQRHREAHFSWGDNPRDDTPGNDDPYLASSYDGDRYLGHAPPGSAPDEDPDEVVGHVYKVEISYEARLTATVVAPSKGRAEDKAKDMRLSGDEDLNGYVPSADLTHEVHSRTDKCSDVTRSDERAERMAGWPW